MQDQQDLQELNVLEKIQVNLPPFYLTESLDSDSLKKVLESSDSVYYGLLIIKNGFIQLLECKLLQPIYYNAFYWSDIARKLEK